MSIKNIPNYNQEFFTSSVIIADGATGNALNITTARLRLHNTFLFDVADDRAATVADGVYDRQKILIYKEPSISAGKHLVITEVSGNILGGDITIEDTGGNVELIWSEELGQWLRHGLFLGVAGA
jgi:hypothetical protein